MVTQIEQHISEINNPNNITAVTIQMGTGIRQPTTYREQHLISRQSHSGRRKEEVQ